MLASILRKGRHGGHLKRVPGAPVVFRHACKMGLEGIVSKRLRSRYKSGRSPDWLKSRTGRRRRSAERQKRIGRHEGCGTAVRHHLATSLNSKRPSTAWGCLMTLSASSSCAACCARPRKRKLSRALAAKRSLKG